MQSARHTARRASPKRSVTPKSRRVRVVGRLDMIRMSTQSFAIRLDDGTEVPGVLTSGHVSALRALLDKQVLVLGRALYGRSGRVLRLEADSVEVVVGLPSIWSKIPGSLERPAGEVAVCRRSHISTSDVDTFFGQWPGPESDEELIALFDEMD